MNKTEKTTMKKGFLGMVAALFVLLVSTSFAQAAANPYVSASAGVSFLTDSTVEDNGVEDGKVEYKTGFAVRGALGLDADMYRLEGEIGYQVNDVDGEEEVEDVSILSFMANGYVDFESQGSALTPYVMAGLGVANVDFDSIEGDGQDDTVFAYQLGAGIAYQATPNVQLDLGYRYFATSDVEVEDGEIELDIDTHNIMAGVRVAL
jgi:opacity protein-like surface antigen